MWLADAPGAQAPGYWTTPAEAGFPAPFTGRGWLARTFTSGREAGMWLADAPGAQSAGP